MLSLISSEMAFEIFGLYFQPPTTNRSSKKIIVLIIDDDDDYDSPISSTNEIKKII